MMSGMFQDLGERLDDWIHEQNLRRIWLLRRLGLLPKPTPEEIYRAQMWADAVSTIDRLRPVVTFPPLGSNPGGDPMTGVKVTFRKYGSLMPTQSDRDALDS